MTSLVCPELPTASAGTSQAPSAAVDNSAPLATRPQSTYKSGKVVQTSGATSGFTLLEMLFVLVVVGLLTGLTAPRFANSFKSRELATQRLEIEDQLRELPRRVRLTAHPLRLPDDMQMPDLGDGFAPLRLPSGWQINFEQPLEISQMGVCSTSVLELAYPGNESVGMRYQVTELTCELTVFEI